jgi:hypothetical protein
MKRPKFMHIIPPGAKVVRRLTWRHRLYRSVPLSIRKWFWA